MKQIFRILARNKVYTSISLLGLTLGFACCFAIVFVIHGIISLDKFHSKEDQLYKVVTFDDVNRPDGYDAVSALLGQSLKDEVPGIENYCRYFWANDLPIGSPDNFLKEPGLFADISLFKMFDFPVIYGNIFSTGFEPNEILISETTANKLFGRTNVVGHEIALFDNNAEKPRPLIVKGVFRDIPFTSTFSFNYVLPFSQYQDSNQASWESIGTRMFVQIPLHTDPEEMNETITTVIKRKHRGFPEKGRLKLVPIINTTLYTFSGSPGPLYFMVIAFAFIGLSILVITIINFINISIAQSVSGAKKTAIRKVNGAGWLNISVQLFFETAILVIVASLMAYFVSPFILRPINENLPLTFGITTPVFLVLLVIIIATIALCVLFPAMYLNRINPATLFQNLVPGKIAVLSSRKFLVITQLTLAIIIITSSSILWQQNRFIYNSTFGMDRMGVVCFNKTRTLAANEFVFSEELLKNTAVTSISFTNQLPISVGNSTTSISWEGKDPVVEDWYSYMYVGYHFVKTLNIKLSDGRDFLPDRNDQGKVIINAKAASMMSMENPVGKQINVFGQDVEIVGFAEDFNHHNIANAVKPLFIICQPKNAGIGMIKLTKGKEQQGLEALKEAFHRFSPDFPLDYFFLDDAFNESHKSFRLLNTATNIFGLNAIIIACIGLLGLSIYINERRRKEIGIRKVNGASIANVTFILYFPIVKWLLIALVPAFIVAYAIMDNVLKSFASRVSITPWPFLLSLFIILFAILLSTGWYIVKLVSQNPVEALRYE